MTLAEYITRLLREPFSWGSNDCVLFAAGWVKCKTGFDHLADQPTWTSAKGAMRIVRDLGGLEKLMDDRFDRINLHMAKDGDLALYKGALCIFTGPHIVGPGPDGLTFINRTEAECAWSC
jgi:hypothetical protein